MFVSRALSVLSCAVFWLRLNMWFGKVLSPPDTEADRKQREEVSAKRKELEAKLKTEQDLEEIKEKNMDDPEEYGADEGESENDEDEDAHEDKEEIPQTLAAGPVSEKDLIMAKLAKLRKANKMGNFNLIYCEQRVKLMIQEFYREKRQWIEMRRAKEKWRNQ